MKEFFILCSIFLLTGCSIFHQKEKDIIVAQLCADNLVSVKITPFNLHKLSDTATENYNSLFLPGIDKTIFVECHSQTSSIVNIGNAQSLRFITLQHTKFFDFKRDFNLYTYQWSNWENPDWAKHNNTHHIKMRFKKMPYYQYLNYLKSNQ